MRYAVLQNNIVKNIIIADENTKNLPTGIFVDSFKEVNIGDLFNGEKFQKPELDEKLLAYNVRQERDTKLLESDVKVLSDRWVKMSEEQQNLWADYRQNLRDITAQEGFPYNIIWPTPPS